MFWNVSLRWSDLLKYIVYVVHIFVWTFFSVWFVTMTTTFTEWKFIRIFYCELATKRSGRLSKEKKKEKKNTNWRLNWNWIKALIAVFVMLSYVCCTKCVSIVTQQAYILQFGFHNPTSIALKFLYYNSLTGWEISIFHRFFFLSSTLSLSLAVRSRNHSQLSSLTSEKLLAVRMFC